MFLTRVQRRWEKSIHQPLITILSSPALKIKADSVHCSSPPVSPYTYILTLVMLTPQHQHNTQQSSIGQTQHGWTHCPIPLLRVTPRRQQWSFISSVASPFEEKLLQTLSWSLFLPSVFITYEAVKRQCEMFSCPKFCSYHFQQQK